MDVHVEVSALKITGEPKIINEFLVEVTLDPMAPRDNGTIVSLRFPVVIEKPNFIITVQPKIVSEPVWVSWCAMPNKSDPEQWLIMFRNIGLAVSPIATARILILY